MDNWTPILEDPHLIQALGYTVLHSLWQGSLVAISYGLWLKKPKVSSEVKYTTGLYALVSMIAMSAITFMLYFGNNDILGQVNPGHSIDESAINVTNAVALVFENPSTLVDYMPLISNIWLCGLLIYSIRIVLDGAFTIYLRKTATPIFDASILKSVKRLSSKMDITKKVMIATSHVAKSPMMIGHLKPIILMPIAIINALSMEEVEAIISHELAHIKRSDYLINLFQTVIEVLYYYHPAVYYISEQIRTEREHCCDDIAINHTQSSLDYAKVLVKLQDIQISRQTSLAMHFKHSNHIFMNRIKRLLHVPSKPSSEKNRIVMMLVLVLLLVGVQQSAHSISRSIDNRLIEPVEFIDQLGTSMIAPIHTLLIEIDTTPKIKTIIKKKTITIIDGDSTITETITERDGSDQGLYFGDDNVVRWFSDGENNFTLKIDSLKGGSHIFDTDIDFDIMIDSLSNGANRLKLFLNDGKHSFKFDTLFNKQNFNMEEMMGEIDVQMFQMDSLMKKGNMLFFDGSNMKEFEFENLEGLKNLERLKGMDHFRLLEDLDGNTHWAHGKDRGNTPADKINRALNRDGLLEINENNKVELSGKNLKINGDKQPKNIHSKYKLIWEEATGVSMSKGDKVTLELKGEEHKRKIERF